MHQGSAAKKRNGLRDALVVWNSQMAAANAAAIFDVIRQWMKSDRITKITEPKTGIRIEATDQVLRLVLISMPEKLVTTWKYESFR